MKRRGFPPGNPYRIQIKSQKLIMALLCSVIFLPFFVQAEFNKNNIISDEAYTDADSMSKDEIQKFLAEKGSGLAGMVVLTSNGEKSPADLFHEAAKAYTVNPRLLIVIAEKESGSITDPDLSEEQKKKLMGYGVWDERYHGIEKQIDNAAWQFRRYFDRDGYFGFAKDRTCVTGDSQEVTPENKATAGLYNYSPSVYSNEHFYNLWHKWSFSDSGIKPVDHDVRKPDGTLVQEVGKPGVYMIRNGERYGFWNQYVFEAYNFNKAEIVSMTSEEINTYKYIGVMMYPDGTLVRSPEGHVYIVEYGKRRGFESREAFDNLGYKMNNIKPLPWNEVFLYPEVEKITVETKKQTNGTLVRSPSDGSVYQVASGKLRPIPDKVIFERNFSWEDTVWATKEQFDSFEKTSFVLFRDGTIILDLEGRVFVIEKGKRRHVLSMPVFQKLGYRMENAIKVSDQVRDLHKEGERLR